MPIDQYSCTIDAVRYQSLAEKAGETLARLDWGAQPRQCKILN